MTHKSPPPLPSDLHCLFCRSRIDNTEIAPWNPAAPIFFPLGRLKYLFCNFLGRSADGVDTERYSYTEDFFSHPCPQDIKWLERRIPSIKRTSIQYKYIVSPPDSTDT